MTADKRFALVTGASSGVGRETALALVKDGFSVAVAGRRETELVKTAEMAGSLSNNVLPVAADVSDEASVIRLFNTIKEKFGRLDLLFNNAGIAIHGTNSHELSLEDWTRLMRINVTGSFLCAQHALRIMLSQTPKGGRIINNGSVSAHVPRVRSTAYTVSKHAITGLTKSLALEYRNDNISCCQLDLGNVLVERTSEVLTGARYQADGEKRPEAQIDVSLAARTVVFLANLPLEANVPCMTLMANAMPYMGRG